MSEARLFTFLSERARTFLFAYLFIFVLFFFYIAILNHQCIIIKYFKLYKFVYTHIFVKIFVLNNVDSRTRNVDVNIFI